MLAVSSSITGQTANGSHSLSGAGVSKHQGQYDRDMAVFFGLFPQTSGREALLKGYFTGLCAVDDRLKPENKKVFVDFGCGSGWLVRLMHEHLGFGPAYGIDSSPDMVRLSLRKTPAQLISSGDVRYFTEPNPSIAGSADLVTAVHSHYHFDTEERLSREFFTPMASLAKTGGDVIVIGCTSELLRDAPEHYKYAIHQKDIPDGVSSKASSLDVLRDKDGYVSLDDIPAFSIPDGTQVRATLFTKTDKGRKLQVELTDTAWSSETLIRLARSCGLDLVGSHTLSTGYERQRPGYRVLRFRKRDTANTMPC